MDTRETLRMLQIHLPTPMLRACLYLEKHGQRFCVDFGYHNAIQKARAHWRARRAKKGSK